MSKIFPIPLPAEIEKFFNPKTVRDHSKKIWDYALTGKTNFIIRENKFYDVVALVLETTKENYPDLNIPFHCRWNHFGGGGIDRTAILKQKLSEKTKEQRACALWDLVIVSVLLDAGAGNVWKYKDQMAGKVSTRSEGLALASFDMFMNGAFSSDPSDPYKVDQDKLMAFSADDLKKGFQVSDDNPLTGIEGRVHLLNKLGKTIRDSQYFTSRPSDLLMETTDLPFVRACDILLAVLLGLGPIWPSRLSRGGYPLGDVWEYRPLDLLVPFHKLSQWLTYSLIAPYDELGMKVTGVDQLTGLPEYRNGGLFVDSGMLELRDPALLELEHSVDSELIIEWRALTICLLDRVGDEVRKKLGKSSADFPLAKVLEGGTWWAGRKLASKLRPDTLSSPIKIISDGTVF
ncbi:MAG: URC4/urg3 family protein [Bacteriovoracaceae bacterium]|jgi:hypothetical protein|nr:URC4/urg3 family protein [Bacteriovoracaceae bacterium]